MLVWIASYPRSGNHLVRMLLKRCFDIGSYEIYQNQAGVMEPALPDVIGAERFDDPSTEQFVDRARTSPELFLVKTHDLVPDADRCIYIVRDARAALVSYQKFLSDFEGQNCSLADLVEGTIWPGNWQGHVERFLWRDPGNTLLLRYEELASGNPPLKVIGDFLGLEPVRTFDIAFSDLHARDSKMFGTGHNRVGVDTIQNNHRDLFWDKCGAMMRRLGYSEDPERHDESPDRSSLLAPALRLRPAAEVLIVTPVFNGAEHLDEAIASVVTQAGDFTIRYHIQDGGSSDGSVEIAHRWRARIESGEQPLHCSGVKMTIGARRDAGMYDAIAKGFRALKPTRDSVMAWINADDRFRPGAFATVAEIFRDHPQVEFAGGRVELMDWSGEVTVSSPVRAVPRQTLAAGLHDGRALPFIQQEGTFWRGSLWNRVGGIDMSFRLAGDWDLWRRFAAEAGHVAIDSVTGSHRRHPGQLMADMGAYYNEVDDRLSGAKDVSTVYRDYLEWWRPDKHADDRYAASIARRDLAGRWHLVEAESLPEPIRHKLLPFDGSWATVSGVDNPEGPFPEMGIETIGNWTIQKVAVLEIFSASAGRRRLSFELRGMVPGQNVDVSIDGICVAKVELEGLFPLGEMITVERKFAVGAVRLEIAVDRLLETPEGRSLGVLLSDLRWEEPPAPRSWVARAREALIGKLGFTHCHD